MARGSLTPIDQKYKKVISSNLQSLASSKNVKQIEIVRATGISSTTVSGYFKGTRLPTPENVDKLAKFFHVSEEAIDPRFEPILRKSGEEQTVSLNAASMESTAPADNKIVDLQADDLDRDAEAAEKEIIKLSAETARWFIKYCASDADLQELEELIEQRKNKR